MNKIIITEPTRTVWSQETKQTDFKLDDEKILRVRRMEDNNQCQTFFFIEGESQNWTDLDDLDQSDVLYDLIDNIGNFTFEGFDKKDEEIDIKEFIASNS